MNLDQPCPGPLPFTSTVCCDEHDEAKTRDLAATAIVNHGLRVERLASAAGVAAADMAGFISGRTSLTPHARARLRASLPGLEQP